MKIYFKVFVLLMSLPFAAFAVGEVILSADSVILQMNSKNWTVTSSSATLDSISVDSSSFTVTMSANQTLKLTSSDRLTLSMPETGSITIGSSCGTSESTHTITNPVGGATVTFTVTPGTTACAVGGGIISGGGSVISGGGGTIAPTIPDQNVAVALTPAVIAPTIPAATVAKPSAVAQAVSPVFNKDLGLGSKGEDVERLQKLLAQDTSVYPEGLITGYFGNLTVQAVKNFQSKYGISQVGRVGPQTRANLAEIFGAGQPPAAVPVPAAPKAIGLTRELSQGASGDDVTALQEFLAKDKDVYPEGLATGYFGGLTVQAVKRFQAKYGISQVGKVGPQTLLKLQELMSGVAVPVPEPTPAPAPTPALPTTAPSSVGTPTESVGASSEIPWFLQLMPAPAPH